MWEFASREYEGVQVVHGKECLIKRFSEHKGVAVDFEPFGLRSVKLGGRFKR